MCARACVGVPKIQQSLVISSVPPSCHIHYLNRIYKCQAHDMDAFCREVGDWISWVCCLCYSSQRLFFRIPYRDYSKHHHLFGIVGRHSTSSSACVSVCVCVRVWLQCDCFWRFSDQRKELDAWCPSPACLVFCCCFLKFLIDPCEGGHVWVSVDQGPQIKRNVQYSCVKDFSKARNEV